MNKSLTSFSQSIWVQLKTWTVARQRDYSWASPPFPSPSLCVVLLLGKTAGWVPLKHPNKVPNTGCTGVFTNKEGKHEHPEHTRKKCQLKHASIKQATIDLTSQHTIHYTLCSPSLQASYLRRAAADWSDLIAEWSHRDQQLVVLVEDTAAGGLIQSQQALTAQHIQGET